MKQVNGLYDSRVNHNKACGYCRHHQCCMTAKQVKAKKCVSKQCHYLVKYENHEYWKQRQRDKEKKKANKQINELLF